VNGLAFRRRSHQLFSGSGDRTLKVWSLDEMAYVETLFGHEDTITGVSALDRDRALSCGARDRSLRLWKIPEESQLVFNGVHGSSDCVVMLNEAKFVSGTDSGYVHECIAVVAAMFC
jgi:ribosomal RNA-processing protein 9